MRDTGSGTRHPDSESGRTLPGSMECPFRRTSVARHPSTTQIIRRDVSYPALICMGGTGDPPVPVGDSPTGTGVSDCGREAAVLAKIAWEIPPGQWPGGTGESPVPPRNLEICGLVIGGRNLALDLGFTGGGAGGYNRCIEFVIRQAKIVDREVIAGFNAALALETEGLRLDLAVVQAGVEAILRDPAKGIYFVAERQGAVMGQALVTYEWSDWRNGNFWWLQSVFVQMEFRAQGVFKALFSRIATEAAAQKDVCGLRLYMERENHRAREVYRRLGMKETHYQVFERMLPDPATRGF